MFINITNNYYNDFIIIKTIFQSFERVASSLMRVKRPLVSVLFGADVTLHLLVGRVHVDHPGVAAGVGLGVGHLAALQAAESSVNQFFVPAIDVIYKIR